MNLKDRLEYIKQTNTISIKDNDNSDSCPGITDVFADSINVRNLILNLIRENKNIIFAGDKSIDKLMTAVYFQSLIGENNSEIINSIDENISNKNFQKNIVPNPDIYNIVKIFEYIIYGYKSFIFGLDLNNSDNFIDKLKTLIALNFKNLTDANINTLIGSSNSAFVFISRNDDGLYFISEINKINYVEGELSFENIFSSILNINTEDVTFDNVSLKPEDGTVEIEIESDEDETDNSADQKIEMFGLIEEENTDIEIPFKNEGKSADEIVLEKTEDADAYPNISAKNKAEAPIEISVTGLVETEETLTEKIKTEEAETAESATVESKTEETQIKEAETAEAQTEKIQIEDVPTEEAQIKEAQIEEAPAKKINKYKLLKEKIKNKKNIL